MRTTKKEVVAVFKAWVEAINGRIATGYNDEGGYILDHNAVYGGWEVQRIDNTRGGFSVIFGRLSAYYFVAALRCGMRSIEQLRILHHLPRCPKMKTDDDGCAHFTSTGASK